MNKTNSDSYFLRIKKIFKPYYLPYLLKFKKARSNKAFKVHGEDILLAAKKALDEIGVHFWLDFGTLLGVYRDGKLISHDFDVDIAIFLKDYSPKIEAALIKHGFKYSHRIAIDDGAYGLEQAFTYANVGFDIFYYVQKEDQMYCHLFPEDENRDRIIREIYTKDSGFRKITFLGQEFNVPKDTEQRLIDTYGEEYRIPISDWYTPDDALNSKLINKNCTETKFK